MLKALLIDDEPESVQIISTLIELDCPDVHLIGKYTDPEEGLAALQEEKPDVLLLDIEMPGMTGFELLDRFGTVDFEVIFITAHTQYAIPAFKENALDYILKPVDSEDLKNALQKAEKKKMAAMLSNLNGSRNRQQKNLLLPNSKGHSYVKIANILRIEADSNYSRFLLREGPPLVVSKNLGTYKEFLDPYDLVCVHRSHIINLHYVRDFIRQDGGYLVLEDGSKVEVSKDKREMVLRRLENL